MIRGRQKYIYAVGDTLWVAVVVIYEGPDTLRKKTEGPGQDRAAVEVSEKNQGWS